MIPHLLLAAVLPALYNGQDISDRIKLAAPAVRYRADVASATNAPWVDANGWRIIRTPGAKFIYDLPEASAALALAEAFANDADAVLKINANDKGDFAAMTRFLQTLSPGPHNRVADIAVIDDGSAQAGEALNLLARKNLLFRIVKEPDATTQLNIRADRSVTNPLDFVMDVRRRLTDEKRSIRLYGGQVVLATVSAEGPRMRVHLVNYGKRPSEGLRIRVRGQYRVERIAIFNVEKAGAEDYTTDETGTEFSVPKLPVYAVIDLISK